MWFSLSLLSLLSVGECYLMEWSDWSPCLSVCAKGAGVDFGSVQVRSRAVMAQEPENVQLCPDQDWESRPCTGEIGRTGLYSLGHTSKVFCNGR